MMENGFLYVCINIYVYLFIFSYPKLCFSYSGIKKEAEGSLFVLVVFFFFLPDFRAVKMDGTRESCLLSWD